MLLIHISENGKNYFIFFYVKKMLNLRESDFESITGQMRSVMINEYKDNCIKFRWLHEEADKYYDRIDIVINYFMLSSLLSFGACMYSQYSATQRFSSNFYFCLGFFILIDCFLLILQISNKFGKKAASHNLIVNFWKSLENKITIKSKIENISNVDFINIYQEHRNLIDLSPKIPDLVYFHYHKLKSRHNDPKNNADKNNKYFHSTEKSVVQVIQRDGEETKTSENV